MSRYVDSLPRGLAAYPDYLMKASAFREFLVEMPSFSSEAVSTLPDALRELCIRPPLVTDWLPEVVAYATFLGLADIFGLSDEEFIAKKLAGNRRLLSSPAYRALFLFLSPETMLRQVERRWEKFHRGLRLTVVELERRSASLRLDYPHNLVPSLQARSYAMAVQAALEAVGAKAIRVHVEATSSSSASYAVAWR